MEPVHDVNIPSRGPAGQPGGEYTPRPFAPAPWLRGAHLQTLGGRLLRSTRPAPGLELRPERIETPDGDFLDLEYALGRGGRDGWNARRPVVLVLHGLGGCSRSGYVLECFRILIAAGLRPVALNFRGCSGEPNRTVRLYHSGETSDLDHVVGSVERRFPDASLGIIGFSLGANVLLKWLGERGAARPRRLAAAVAISAPYDLAACADHLERRSGRPYARYLVRSLRTRIRAKAARFPGAYDLARALAARTLREFDDAVTAPVHGFEDADDYYRRSSSAPYLPRVRVATLLLHAADDPFVPAAVLPRRAVSENPWLVDGLVSAGGHVGFIQGRTPRARSFWAEEEAARFVAARVGAPPRRTNDRAAWTAR